MKPARILFVDDEPNVLLMVGDLLKMEGYEVVTATSGDDALQALRTQPADLVILDVSMPGMTGLALMKKLSGPDGKPRYPILIFSARANMESFFKTTGVEGFLAKTSDPSQLITEVKRVLLKTRVSTPDAASSTAKPRKVIILLEDEPIRNQRLKTSFTLAGYETLALTDSHQLVETLQTHTPTVIVLKSLISGTAGSVLAAQLADYTRARSIPVILYDDSGIIPPENTFPGVTKFVPSSAPADLLKTIATITK